MFGRTFRLWLFDVWWFCSINKEDFFQAMLDHPLGKCRAEFWNASWVVPYICWKWQNYSVRISCNWRNGLQLACRHKTFLFNLTSAYPCFSLTLVKRCKKRVGSKDSIPIHSTIILISREACLLHLIPQDLEGQNAFTPSNQATQSLVNLDSDKKTWAQRLPRNPKPDALGAWSTISIYFDFVVGFYCG